MRKELSLFIFGTVTLVGGNIGDLSIPYFIGRFVDTIGRRDFQEVYTLCWQLVLIVLVKIPPVITDMINYRLRPSAFLLEGSSITLSVRGLLRTSEEISTPASLTKTSSSSIHARQEISVRMPTFFHILFSK